MSEEIMSDRATGLDTLSGDKGEVVLGIESVDELGGVWQDDIGLVKRCKNNLNEYSVDEVKKYLECVNILAKTGRELISLRKGVGSIGGSEDGLLKALGIE
jgi:hypothetical protein